MDLCACVARDQAQGSGMLGKYQAAFPPLWFEAAGLELALVFRPLLPTGSVAPNLHVYS